ncbi:MAG: class I SAM-dependent methyltransferase [Actinomycetota bacterium]|nr:class I SAM-dependent methyltransferase [Actinomycetota bacterium]
MAEGLGCTVIGIDASRAMVEQAHRFHAHPRVSYVQSTAEHLPLARGSADMILASMVLQHIPDRAQFFRELARVLCPRGVVVIDSLFADDLPELEFYRFFPRARALDAERFPAGCEIVVLGEQHGFRVAVTFRTRYPHDVSLADFAARIRQRPFSTFQLLSEREVSTGLAELDAAVLAQGEARPIDEVMDRMVLILADPL